MDLAKDARALLPLRGALDVRLHGNVSGLSVRLGTPLQKSGRSRWDCLRKSKRRSEMGRQHKRACIAGGAAGGVNN